MIVTELKYYSLVNSELILMVNILIVNFGNTGNKGATALLYTKIKLLNGIFKEKVRFTIAVNPSLGPVDIRNDDEYDVGVVNLLINDSPLISLGKLLLSVSLVVRHILKKFSIDLNFKIGGKELEDHEKKHNSKNLCYEFLKNVKGYLILIYTCLLFIFKIKTSRLYPEILTCYLDADYIFNTGGDVLTESYGTVFAFFSNLLFGLFLSKPIIIWAESIGPFNNRLNRIIARYIFHRTKLLTVRENISLKHLRNMGINGAYLTADLAFTMNPAAETLIDTIMKKEKLDKSHNLFGMNVSGIISHYIPNCQSNTEGHEKYVEIMSKVADYIIETHDAQVVFIPHVYAPLDSDDRKIAMDVYKHTKNKRNVKLILNEYDPEELKGIISNLDMFLGARMHSTIASTSMNVPTIALAYSDKTYGIIGEMLGYNRFILGVNNLNLENLILLSDELWENRAEISKDLACKTPKIIKNAYLNVELLDQLIDIH